MSIKIITSPIAEQITLAEAKIQLRVDDDGGSPPSHLDDALIESLIASAREWCEHYTGRALAPQTIEVALDAFPTSQSFGVGCRVADGTITTTSDAIQLPMSPLASIASVKYIDGDGVEQTLASSGYVVDDYQEPGWLMVALGAAWPATSAVVNAVKIRYFTGYTLPGGSPSDKPLPKSIKSAMLLILGSLYEQREDSSPIKQEQILLGATTLLDFYRLRKGFA